MKRTCLCSPTHPPLALRRSMSFRSAVWKALGSSLLFLLTAVQMASGQNYNVTTLYGTPGITGQNDSPGVFNAPFGITRDNNGNVYVAERDNHIIRKITPGGQVSTLAGLAGVSGSTDGTGNAARFNNPRNVTVDASGNVYVSDSGNNTIRKVTPLGVVTTLAGTAGASGSTDATGTNARFNFPRGLVYDGSANLYVCDNGNATIRKIVIATAVVTTFAGSAGNAGDIDGIGSQARINIPAGIAIDNSGTLYISQLSGTVRKISPAAEVTTIAGVANQFGSADGVGSAARFGQPYGITVDGTSNTLFVSEDNGDIRRILPDGTVTTLCGISGQNGHTDGTGKNVRFFFPDGIIFDGTSNTLLVSELGNHDIRRVTLDGTCTTWVGTPGLSGATNSAGSFDAPYSTAVDSSGNVYVADQNNSVIRKVTPQGRVTTLAGLVGTSGSADGSGSAARFNQPAAVTVDTAGNVYVGDTSNHTIRKITPAGVVTTIAGMAGTFGTADGTGNGARFNKPYGITVDKTGTNLYVGDFNNDAVRKVVIASGLVTTIAGTAGVGGSFDATGAAARFDGPVGVALDPTGTNLYVADYNNRTIRKVVVSSAVVTTVAGTEGAIGNVDGLGTAARFTNPRELACDSAGNLFIIDVLNHSVRKMTPAGVVTTLAGGAGSGAVDGVGSTAKFTNPAGVCVDAGGNLFVGDESNHAIRKVSPGGVVTTFAGTLGLSGNGTDGTFNQPSGIVRDAAGNLFVTEVDNHVIRKITPSGVVTTLAGLAGTPGTANGTGSAARFNSPRYQIGRAHV